MTSVETEMVHLKDYAETPYSLDQVALAFEIFDGKTKVSARLELAPRAGTKAGTPLRLDGEALDLVALNLDGKALGTADYVLDKTGLTIAKVPNAPFVLQTIVEISPEANSQLMGLYRSNGIWCTQCEAEGFRRITFFYDRPDVLSRFKVRIEADKAAAPVLLSNGNLVESGNLDGDRHFAVWEDPFPKPSYLFALVAGDLEKLSDRFVTMSGRAVELGIYVEHGKAGRARHAMESLKRAMKWDEERFGREYDLDLFNIVAVSDFNAGAMENKGLNIFNDRLVLADPATATDQDFERIEGVIAHEYFHNWTGNRVTCRDWFQLCLKEGLTVFRDQEFTSDMHSRPVKRISDVRILRTAQFPEDAGPLAHPARPDAYRTIDNFYTATVYEKGAEIVRMLATLLGPEAFRKGTDLYFERHDGDATTIEAWLKAFEDATGRDLTHFGKWYTQAGTPKISAFGSWVPENRSYTLKICQVIDPTPGQPSKTPMVLPIKFGLVGANGHDMTFESVSGGTVVGDMIIADGEETEITFSGLAGKPVPSLFRGFSAPVIADVALTNQERAFLARHDTDPFNRWQAVQDIALEILTSGARGGGIDKVAEQTEALVAAFADTLAAPDLDDAFKAQILSLPSEAEIARILAHNVDPDAIHAARQTLLVRIGDALGDDLAAAHDRLAELVMPYRLDGAAMGARDLRNRCLALYAVRGDAAAERVSAHYHQADNMTDRMAALGAAIAASLSNADALLDDFRDRFGADPLVYDKWLRLVAGRPDADGLERVEAIWNDPDFPRANPNRLRALIGGFFGGSPTQFARPDGKGFRFVAEVCRQIDGINPYVAAQLATAFRSFRAFEAGRRTLAEEALTALRDGAPLSANVRDIVDRTLGD